MTRANLELRLRRRFDDAERQRMIDCCEHENIREIAGLEEVPRIEWAKDRFYYYWDRGHDILAVCHLDSVCPIRDAVFTKTGKFDVVLSGVLDDRLGLWAILFLDRMGIQCDWLFTTDEEKGCSTAQDFADDFVGKDGRPDKQYNWIIQFDRGVVARSGGNLINDVVCYEYETQFLKQLVEMSGASIVSRGMFSDICKLEALGCKAMNWGIGYRDYHGKDGYAFLDDIFGQLARFVRFYYANKTTILKHTPTPKAEWKGYTDGGYGGWLFTARSSASIPPPARSVPASPRR